MSRPARWGDETMQTALLVAGLVTFAVGGGMFVNEMSHGALSEAMGLGHHHMFDTGGIHCAAHDDARLGADHVAHMHGASFTEHGQCAGGAAMHGPRDGGMMRNGTGPMGSGLMQGGAMHG